MLHKLDFVLEAGTNMMKILKGSYSCICLVNGVGLVAFRDTHGIRYARVLCFTTSAPTRLVLLSSRPLFKVGIFG